MGLYDSAPSRRFAWDADGSTFYTRQGGSAWSALSQANAELLNSEENTTLTWPATEADPKELVILFPEAREIDGIYCASRKYATDSYIKTFETSTDTTNGSDGTWSAPVTLAHHEYAYTDGSFRNDIESQAISGVVGIRFSMPKDGLSYGDYRSIHIYGSITSATEDRMEFLDPSNSDAVYLQPIDYEELPRGTTSIKTMKVKNVSPTLTASTVQVTCEDLYLDAGDMYDFSLDGSTSWQATLSLGNFSPGDTLTFYMRQQVPDAATLELQTARIKVNVGSWA